MRSKKKHAARLALLALVFLTAVATSAFSAQETATPQPAPRPRFMVGVYFEGSMLNDENLTEFYKHSQRNYFGFEASVHTMYNIDVWGSYRRYTDETETTFFEHLTKFGLNQLSLGVVYRPIVWKVLEPFIGAGLEIYSYKEEVAEEDTDLPDTTGSAVGFHIQGGTYINIYKFLGAKVFIRQNFVKDTLEQAIPGASTELDLGGTEFGAGLVIRF